MNKKAIAFLLTMTFLPLTCFFGYWFFVAVTDKRSGKEIFLDMRKDYSGDFKIEKIYHDKPNHNTMTLTGKDKNHIYTVEREWEKEFKIGDSIVKKKDSLRIFIYRNQRLDTILDYRNIFIREDV